MTDAITGKIETVEGKDVFWRRIGDRLEGAELAGDGLRRLQVIGDLDETFSLAVDDDEIDLAFVGLADEDVVATGDEFIVDDVFEKKCVLKIDEVGVYHAKASVNGVLLFDIGHSLFADDVEALHAADEAGFFHAVEVAVDGGAVDGVVVLEFEEITDVLGGKLLAGVRHDIAGDLDQSFAVGAVWVGDDVFVDDALVGLLEIGFDLSFLSEGKAQREPAPLYIVEDEGVGVGGIALLGEVVTGFFEGKWQDAEFLAAADKKGSHLAGKKLGIAASDEDGAVLGGAQ